jgi:hypothetical protein
VCEQNIWYMINVWIYYYIHTHIYKSLTILSESQTTYEKHFTTYPRRNERAARLCQSSTTPESVVVVVVVVVVVLGCCFFSVFWFCFVVGYFIRIVLVVECIFIHIYIY